MEKYFSALGRRKTAVAQARVEAGGKGTILVNGKPFEDFFTTEELRAHVARPLKETGKLESVNVSLKTSGGGIVGQADASRLAIARALIVMEDTVRGVLKSNGLLTRDPRKKERKKPGKRGARRSPQWRKR